MTSIAATKLRHHRLWTTLGWLFVALVIYLSLMRPPSAVSGRIFDVGHVFAYAWLMTWFVQIYRPSALRFAIGAALCALGVALEIAQGMTGYRMFDYADMAMNALGVVVGLALARTPAQDVLRSVERRLAADRTP